MDVPGDSWEHRMAARAAERRKLLVAMEAGDVFAQWRLPSDPPDILPQILAARCLGIEYGDPGPRIKDERVCRQCWGTHYVWYGNCWGLDHAAPGRDGCDHECHDGEVWLAAPDVRRRRGA
jgi:hypothetical protein